MNIIDLYKRGTSLMQLIYINVAVFIIVKLAALVCVLFNVHPAAMTAFIELPSNLGTLIRQPWSVLTYMFFHEGFSHIFFNMLALYWFGRIALEYFSQRQLVWIYLLGGVVGAVVYLLSYNLFPYFSSMVGSSYLLGASGAVIAVCVAVATVSPNYPIRLLFIGEIKLVWLAVGMVLISLFGITGSNAGGEFAHIGGALFGYIFGLSWKKGSDWSRPFVAFGEWVKRLFKPQPKIKVTKGTRTAERPMTDAEYNRQQKANSVAIDAILDKIKQRGYESLTADEKRELFDRSKR